MPPLPSASSPVGGRARADQLTVRRTNLALVLRHLRDAGPRSRARIAADTGLNKATVSSLVAELVERGLVVEGAVDRMGAVGRPGQIVEVDGRTVAGIGVEVNVDYIAAVVLNLRDETLFEQRLAHDTRLRGPERTLDAVGDLSAQAVSATVAMGARPVGITMAVPGLIETAAGMLTYAPNFGWRDVLVVDALARRLGHPAYPILVDNDANLSALGEFAMGAAAGTQDLLYLTGEVGVGGGVIVGGQLVRGAEGFSGEVGHMPLAPGGHRCGCGRRGCWETMVGLSALLRVAADDDDPVRDPSLDLEQRLAEIDRRAKVGDARTLAALDEIGTALGVGASILVNVFNPRAIVLGGYFAVLGDYLVAPMTAELRDRVIAPDLAGCHIELSTLGFTAAIRGGAHVALDAVLDDPMRVAPAVPSHSSGGIA
jgi:predicted NBD/HSP70 family sugar kinase